MKEINKIFFIITLSTLFFFSIKAESNTLSLGDSKAQITVKVFSSLTCPHCASFHKEIFESLKKDFINKGLVRFEHHGFPLDLAALNAEKIVRCHLETTKSFKLLEKIYDKQNNWAIGSDINPINESLKKIGLSNGLNEKKMDMCLKDENTQDQILNERIEAQKRYKIQSTPTVIINEKKYEGSHNYKEFKKEIEKLL
tara:strand:- start:93 stop:686 length:594 start_codon:yes stop_codon:yes gene_type:complete